MRVCSVTWQRWRWRHSIHHSREPAVHANFTALSSMEPELLPIEVLHGGNREFRDFLLLWPWRWPDDRHIRTWSVSSKGVPAEQRWTFYVKAFKNYCITGRHTDRQTPPNRYHAASQVVKNYVTYTVAGGGGHAYSFAGIARLAGRFERDPTYGRHSLAQTQNSLRSQ